MYKQITDRPTKDNRHTAPDKHGNIQQGQLKLVGSEETWTVGTDRSLEDQRISGL